MITFEKIREFERAERESNQLEKLPDNIMQELGEYLKRKESIEKKTEFDIHEIENAKNTIKRLLELRERKIMNLAIYSARTGLPVENLTKNEEELFNKVVEALKRFREKFYEDLENPKPLEEYEESEKKQEKIEKETNESKIKYKVVKELPNFVGPDGKEYSFHKGDILDENDIPKPLNDLLLKKGVIEKME